MTMPKNSPRPPPLPSLPQTARARRKNGKRCGERSEAAFLHKASSPGFGVAKPWGDSERYDFILDNGERLLRAQIKSTDTLRSQAYETRATYSVGKSRAVYSSGDIDFLVAHVVPLDVWSASAWGSTVGIAMFRAAVTVDPCKMPPILRVRGLSGRIRSPSTKAHSAIALPCRWWRLSWPKSGRLPLRRYW
jgi:PD-(D/E)XK endonuclease